MINSLMTPIVNLWNMILGNDTNHSTNTTTTTSTSTTTTNNNNNNNTRTLVMWIVVGTSSRKRYHCDMGQTMISCRVRLDRRPNGHKPFLRYE